MREDNFANLSREEVEAMLGVNLEETRVSQYNETTKYWGGHQKLVEVLRSHAVPYLESKLESMVMEDKYSLADVDVDKHLVQAIRNRGYTNKVRLRGLKENQCF